MSTAAQLAFIASLREEEDEDSGMVNIVLTENHSSIRSTTDLPENMEISDRIKFLYFAPEGVGVTREDVQTYKKQLNAGKDKPGLTVVLPTVNRSFALSDEPSAVAAVDRESLQKVIAQLNFDIQPLVRAWSGNAEAIQAQYYNYGLNETLLKEYLEHQISLRLTRAQRQAISTGHMAPQPQQYPPASDNTPQKAVYVVGFPIEWAQAELHAFFSRFAPVESVAVISKRGGTHAKGAGFVNFVDLEGAARAVEATNGRGLDGRSDIRMGVSFARPKQPRY